MTKYNNLTLVIIGIFLFILVCGFASTGQCQIYPINPFWGFNPYFAPFAPAPFPCYPCFSPIYPVLRPPMLAPPLPTRVGAATLIITNPTAGTVAVTVINPTVATAPTVAAVPPSSPPLLTLLATLYSSALYEGLLSTANPLLFALLQNLFL